MEDEQGGSKGLSRKREGKGVWEISKGTARAEELERGSGRSRESPRSRSSSSKRTSFVVKKMQKHDRRRATEGSKKHKQ
jgi:hypothetical protein